MDKEEIQFINPPTYDYNCPVCLQLLKDAYQTTCCGNHICHDCTEQIKAMPDVKCPKCRDVNFDANKDIFFSRQLLNMEVYCSYSMVGCTWTGELHNLEGHLETTCKRDVTTCKHCNLEVDDSFENHLLICNEVLLDCPNACAAGKQKRKHMQSHLESSCPLRVIIQPLIDSIPYIASNTTVSTVPVSFIMTNYSQYLQSGDVWYSPPFATHNGGYKLQLEVMPCKPGVESCQHIALYARLLKGENDNNLIWPFEADIVVELLNWKSNVNHHSHTISFNERTLLNHKTQVESAEDGYYYWGKHEFIACSSLPYNCNTNTEYLQQDCLRFRVRDIAVYSIPFSKKVPVWQNRPSNCFEFTLAAYTRRMQLNNIAFSPPFYSSQGYRMCLKVYTNGLDSGKGTYIALFVYLMKGEHDDMLCWPFTGDVVIEILNWKNDCNHFRKVITIDDDSLDKSRSKVMKDGVLGDYGRGYQKFLLLNSLFQQGYVENDCIRIRVYDVAVYNTPLLRKFPQWRQRLWWNTSSSWLLEFTVTGVSKHKMYDTEHLSPPFYTHNNGYKMRLEVCPNGYGDGEGTHLSIFARLLKGENDHNLKWPMNIELPVELLNWKSNVSHIYHQIKFSEASDNACMQVVGDNKKTDMAQGWHKFCTHRELFINTHTVQYVQEDCIRLRVKTAIIHSKKKDFAIDWW